MLAGSPDCFGEETKGQAGCKRVYARRWKESDRRGGKGPPRPPSQQNGVSQLARPSSHCQKNEEQELSFNDQQTT